MAGVPGPGANDLAQSRSFRGYVLDQAYDEMFGASGTPREAYATLFERLLTLDPTELRQRQSAADLAFLNQGITLRSTARRKAPSGSSRTT